MARELWHIVEYAGNIQRLRIMMIDTRVVIE